MAAWAVEAMMLRYQITIVSSTVGVASREYLQREIHHSAVQTLACGPNVGNEGRSQPHSQAPSESYGAWEQG